jgi:hypothetical protein
MKASKLSLAILGSMLFISSIACAQEKGKLVLYQSVSVRDTVLKPGTYTLEWNVKDSSAEVRFVQDKKTIAIVHGTIVSCHSANVRNGYEYEAQSGGGYLMTAYSPEKMKYKLVLHDERPAK